MNQDPVLLLDRLANTDWQVAMVISGGGSGVIGRCIARSGASRNFVEAVIPYSRRAMVDYLGAPTVGPAASPATAKQLAHVALSRSISLSDVGPRLVDASRISSVGIAMVAALPTHPPRDQVHQVHVVTERRSSDGSADEVRVSDVWSHEFAANEFAGDSERMRESAELTAQSLFFRAIESLL